MQVTRLVESMEAGRWLTPNELVELFGFMAIETGTSRTARVKAEVKEGDIKEKDNREINLAGSWQGAISQLGLRVVFHIKKIDGKYTAKTDSPDQGVYGIKTGITVSEGDLQLDIHTPNPSSFSGTLKGKTIEGTFSQSGNEWPLKLRK